jgi:hypothetical protein
MLSARLRRYSQLVPVTSDSWIRMGQIAIQLYRLAPVLCPIGYIGLCSGILRERQKRHA